MQSFVSAAISNEGRVRSSNQDSFYVNDLDGLWIVADGMGGHSHGKTASQMACNVVSQQLAEGHDMPYAVEAAHKAIQQLSNKIGAVNGMGTTFVAISKTAEEHIDIWWLGDSRAYMQLDSELTLLTHDHSVVQELIDAQLISSAQASGHSQSHIITRALGIQKKLSSDKVLKLDHKRIRYQTGTQFLLCSDGLNKEISEQSMQSVLSTDVSLESKANALVDQANASGGSDNITVLLIQESKHY